MVITDSNGGLRLSGHLVIDRDSHSRSGSGSGSGSGSSLCR